MLKGLCSLDNELRLVNRWGGGGPMTRWEGGGAVTLPGSD